MQFTYMLLIEKSCNTGEVHICCAKIIDARTPELSSNSALIASQLDIYFANRLNIEL